MGSRGRKSADSLSVIQNNPIEIVQRPDAPYDLTDEQVDEWRAVVASLPADWFQRGNHALLTQYCREVVAARRVAQLIEQCVAGKTIDHKEFCDLLKLQEASSRTISALLRSMRLTQQSVMRAETAKRPSKVKKPWDAET
jgi:phage terminase small subunit